MIEIVGKKFGRWTVVSFDRKERRRYYWNCVCECGSNRSIFFDALKNGKSKSCGCFRSELARLTQLDHGESNKTKEYKAWCHIIFRCKDTNNKKYFGRGIRVCKRWLKSYRYFLKDMGRAPSAHHSIDRKNNNGNYTPSNCRWATQLEQQNNRRDNVLVKYNGKVKTVAQWCRELKLPYDKTRKRITTLKWSVAKAFYNGTIN